MTANGEFAIQMTLIATVLTAALTDLLTRQIPNWITVPALLMALALHAWFGGPRALALSMLGALLGFTVFFLLYLAGGMGAGDVKMFAAVGAFLGPQPLVFVFIATGLLGGLAGIGLALARGRLRQTLSRTGQILLGLGRLQWQEVRRASSLESPDALRLPYGAVIAAGTLLFLTIGR